MVFPVDAGAGGCADEPVMGVEGVALVRPAGGGGSRGGDGVTLECVTESADGVGVDRSENGGAGVVHTNSDQGVDGDDGSADRFGGSGVFPDTSADGGDGSGVVCAGGGGRGGEA